MDSCLSLPYMPFPSFEDNHETAASADAQVHLNPDCGSAGSCVYDSNAQSDKFILANRICDEETLGKAKSVNFPFPMMHPKRPLMYPDPVWTADDIVRKYGREIDLSGFDFMDSEFNTWDETTRSPLEILVNTDRNVKKLWKMHEASVLLCTRDDPQYLGNCLDVKCTEGTNKIAVAVADGGFKGRVKLNQGSLCQGLFPGRLDADIDTSAKIKFSEKVTQIRFLSGDNSNIVACRSESCIYLVSFNDHESSSCTPSKESTEFFSISGTFRHLAVNPFMPGEILALRDDDKALWGDCDKELSEFEGDIASKYSENVPLTASWSDHPRIVYLSGCRQAKICDLRTGSIKSAIFKARTMETENIETVGDKIPNTNMIPILTDKRVVVVDERRPNEAVKSWNHSLVGGLKFFNSCAIGDNLSACVTQRLFNDTVCAQANKISLQAADETYQYWVSSRPPYRLKNVTDVLILLKCESGNLSRAESVERRVQAPIRGAAIVKTKELGPAFLITSSDCGDVCCQAVPNSVEKLEEDTQEAETWEDFISPWKAHLNSLEVVCPKFVYSGRSDFRPSFSVVDVSGPLSNPETRIGQRAKEEPSDRNFGGPSSNTEALPSGNCTNCRQLAEESDYEKLKEKETREVVRDVIADDQVSKLILDVWNET